jgi:hypothetical protein
MKKLKNGHVDKIGDHIRENTDGFFDVPEWMWNRCAKVLADYVKDMYNTNRPGRRVSKDSWKSIKPWVEFAEKSYYSVPSYTRYNTIVILADRLVNHRKTLRGNRLTLKGITEFLSL